VQQPCVSLFADDSKLAAAAAMLNASDVSVAKQLLWVLTASIGNLLSTLHPVTQCVDVGLAVHGHSSLCSSWPDQPAAQTFVDMLHLSLRNRVHPRVRFDTSCAVVQDLAEMHMCPPMQRTAATCLYTFTTFPAKRHL
jgi:hypothetical protein